MSIKIIVKEWLWNPLDFFVISSFFSFFASDRAQRSIRQVYHFEVTEQTDRNIELIYSFTISEQKTKDCARSGSFEHKRHSQHRCF